MSNETLWAGPRYSVAGFFLTCLAYSIFIIESNVWNLEKDAV